MSATTRATAGTKRADDPEAGSQGSGIGSAAIVLAAGGDVDAFELLYRRTSAQVYGTCRRLLDSEQDAEDMTQRVFLRAWRRLATFRGESALGAWLRRLAVNLIIDERRARWREEVESLGAEDADLASPEPRQSNAAVDLGRALRDLACGPRRVLLLHDVEGFTHAEIAQLLGVTIGTTKTQLFRARRALRGRLR